MGAMKYVSRILGNERRKSRMYKLSRDIQEFYATHPFSTWQQNERDEIRKEYERKQEALNIAHDNASSRLAEEFAQFELDYLWASQEYKEQNPDMQWHPAGVKGIFTQAFWHNLGVRARRLGITHAQEDK